MQWIGIAIVLGLSIGIGGAACLVIVDLAFF
jgi:hypothetical protein